MQHFNSNYIMYHNFINCFRLPFNYSAKSFTTISKAKSKTQITIPKAIKRSPTDILEALSATVKKDYTGPHYKYLDDPYLTPVNNIDKRTFSLSKEAGRKAAFYFFDKYPQYFYRDTSEPKIEAFTYKEVYDDGMEFSQFDLDKSITRSDVSNAIVCYNNLVQQGKQISEETLLDLLDLVSFYNCEDLPDSYVEENWFKKNYENRIESNFWKDNGFAEQLFESLENKSSRAYCSVVQGMCKYFQTERAFAFYKQAIDFNYQLNAQTYNSLILSSYNLHPTNEERWKTVLDLLKTMNNSQIRPDIGTLNAVLKQISKYKFWNLNIDLAKKTFNEFAFKFNIDPSLATYYHLLNIFYKTRSSRSSLIYEIVEKISRKTFDIQDADDIHFFACAMDICLNLNDLQIAYKVHQIFEKNEKLIGRGINQNNYHNRFLKLLCSSESIENFMIIYTKYVPHIYTPNYDLMEQILKTLKIYKTLDYVPQIWNDLVLFAYVNKIELIQSLLMTMDEIKKGDPLVSTFNNLVLDVFERVNFKINRNIERGYSQNVQWTAKSLSYCISILVKAENVDSAFEVLKKLNELKDELLDQPESQALIDFCKQAISMEKYDSVLYCLKYCKDMDKIDVINDVVKETENLEFKDEIRNTIKSFL